MKLSKLNKYILAHTHHHTLSGTLTNEGGQLLMSCWSLDRVSHELLVTILLADIGAREAQSERL